MKFSILRFFEGRKINLPSMYVFEWLDLRRKFFFCGEGLGLLLLYPPGGGGYLKHSEDLCVIWHVKDTSSSKRTVFSVVKKCRQPEMSKATLVSLTTICQLKGNNYEEMNVVPPTP